VPLSIEITLVRHGETTANVAGVWQGWSNAGFSPRGREQVKRLAARISTSPYDLVVSSDLGRAMATAGTLGVDVESDQRWRELNLGDWEGKTRDEVLAAIPDLETALERNDDVSFGGGERLSEMVGRVTAAFHDLAARLDDGQRALVVTHGGAIFGLTSALLGTSTRGRLLRLTNTSLTTWRLNSSGNQMAVYNDATHLPGAVVRAEPDASHVYLIRHGETEANVDHRWQGHEDGILTHEGREQAHRLALVLPDLDALYSSPLGRARDTAVILATTNGWVVETVDAVKEIGFGSWENRSRDEIGAMDPDGLAAIDRGEDSRRGGTGETYGEVRSRMVDAVEKLAARHPGGSIGIVSHGGAMRAFGTVVLGLDFATRHRLPVAGNTSIAHFVYGRRGPALAGWNLTPHLGRATIG
jgi:probable phosphoglycerate mutase